MCTQRVRYDVYAIKRRPDEKTKRIYQRVKFIHERAHPLAGAFFVVGAFVHLDRGRKIEIHSR